MSVFEIIAVISLGYFMGSISFAVLIARAHRVDIFAEGSGNPGATNIKRTIGQGAGNLCFALDALKGSIAAGWPLLPVWSVSNPTGLGVLGLLAAIFGHSFSVFLKFRGGKGVATTMGGLLILMPWVVLIGTLLWLVIFSLTRYVALASIAFGLSLPFSSLLLREPWEGIGLAFLLAAFIVIRHRSNIKRLLKGSENRFMKEK